MLAVMWPACQAIPLSLFPSFPLVSFSASFELSPNWLVKRDGNWRLARDDRAVGGPGVDDRDGGAGSRILTEGGGDSWTGIPRHILPRDWLCSARLTYRFGVEIAKYLSRIMQRCADNRYEKRQICLRITTITEMCMAAAP